MQRKQLLKDNGEPYTSAEWAAELDFLDDMDDDEIALTLKETGHIVIQIGKQTLKLERWEAIQVAEALIAMIAKTDPEE